MNDKVEFNYGVVTVRLNGQYVDFRADEIEDVDEFINDLKWAITNGKRWWVNKLQEPAHEGTQ